MLIQLLVIQIVTFAALIFVLRFSLYKHLDGALKRLKVLHQENLDREAELKEELEKARQERLLEIERGKEEAGKIVEIAKKEAQRVRMSAQEEARQQAEQIIQKSKEEFEKLRRNLLAEMEVRALNLSLQILEHTFSPEGKEALHRQFIEEIIQELQGLEKSKFSVRTKNIKIKTSYPLDSKEKEAIRRILSEKVAMSVELEEQVDRELIIGLVIQIDSLIIDGSLQNRLRKVIPYLRV